MRHSRIPSLDGARACSILLVLYAHLATSGASPFIDRLWRFDLGNLGVRVFFVISGYLITSLLMVEFATHGNISLKHFYIRRFFRIVPAFWVLLATVAIVIPTGVVSATYGDIAAAGLYIANYLKLHFSVGHSWSLAVEEQFYLLWPLAIVAFGWRRATQFALATLVFVPLLRVASDLGYWHTSSRYAFETVCDAIASGCLLAILRDRLWTWPRYRRLVNSRLFVLLPILVVAVLAARPSVLIVDVVGIGVLNISIAMFLDHVMRHPLDPIGRLLNSTSMKFLGLMSYSIYLWQQLWFDPAHRTTFPFSVGMIALCASISYWLVEKPALGLGRRFIGRYKRRADAQLAQ